MWPVLTSCFEEVQKVLARTHVARFRSPADLVQRYQRMIDIQRCVFHSFSHDGTSELLPPHHEHKPRFPLIGEYVRKIPQKQRLFQEIETARVQVRSAPPNFLQGFSDVLQ